ncbi:MAG: di-heme enzyme [Cellvibrionaceae bacterium]|nr:di-heme enzyme [Cellvibrionaceae bacterium]
MRLLGACFLLLCLCACKESETTFQETQNQQSLRQLLELPDHFPLPAVPEFNPITQEKITLGRHLFYDKRLSANQTQSCESCHLQHLAFSDGEYTPIGSTGDVLSRNSQSLSNAVYHSTLTWANNSFFELEDQLEVPIRSDNPVELGVSDAQVDTVLARFDSDPKYVEMFNQAFPNSASGATINKIIFALASFCRSLISAGSDYDRFIAGDDSALNEQQKLGFSLFNGEKFECFHCHSGINFSVSYRDSNSNSGSLQFPFFNNGLYNIGGDGSYPVQDQGLFDLTSNPSHKGLFRPQGLRNIALTAPYMHDGSIETLREVILHYAGGGRVIEEGVNAGDGRFNPNKSGLIIGFDPTEEEIDAVIAFLESLTDYDFISNPKFSDPFNEQ